MRKSNWIILAVLAVACGIFLWLWYYLSFNFVDDPLDLVIAIVWWAVVIATVLGIRAVEKKRQERVRTAYLAPQRLFNSEAGLVTVEPGTSVVDALAQVLGNLKYSFEMADVPEPDEVRFTHVVRTKKFEDEGETWEGEVAFVARPNDEPRSFETREELARILEEAPVVSAGSGSSRGVIPTAAKTAPLGA